MNRFKIFRFSSAAFMLICTLGTTFLLIFYSRESFSGAFDGLKYSLNVLVPSLFPFMFLSSFIIKSGVFMPVAKVFGKPAKKIFNISSMGVFAFILSMIGGYPVGAKCISDLYSQKLIGKAEAKRLIMYCVGAGPGFLITFVGTNLLDEKRIGYILLAAQIITMITLSFALRNMYKSDEISDKKNAQEMTFLPFANSLVESAEQTSVTCLNMCGLVIVFSALTNILSGIFKSSFADMLIFSVFEVTNACNKLCGNIPLFFIGFLTGYGGICVHFQIYKILRGIDFSKLLFTCFRLLQGILNALFTYILLMVFPCVKDVFSTAGKVTVSEPRGGILAGAVLLICSVCFLFSLKKN